MVTCQIIVKQWSLAGSVGGTAIGRSARGRNWSNMYRNWSKRCAAAWLLCGCGVSLLREREREREIEREKTKKKTKNKKENLRVGEEQPRRPAAARRGAWPYSKGAASAREGPRPGPHGYTERQRRERRRAGARGAARGSSRQPLACPFSVKTAKLRRS